jgi:hypothetical protein
MDQAVQTALGERPTQPGWDNHIGPRALVPIRHLFRQNRVECRRRHPGSRQNPQALKKRGRTDHRHQITAQVRAPFQQQRDIQHHDGGATPPVRAQKRQGFSRHQRVQKSLEPRQCGGISENPTSQCASVHRAILGHSRKRRLDSVHRRPARRHQRMHGRIGVMNRDPHPPQHRGGG